MSSELTHNQLIKKLNYDSITGIFTWKNNNKLAGHFNILHDGYIRIKINGINYLAHRVAWFYYYGYWPEKEIDHKDLIKQHNWIKNLKKSTRMENMRNTLNPKTNSSGVKGVYWVKNKNLWQVRIYVKGKPKGLGYHINFEEAVYHRLAAEQCLNWNGHDSNSPAFLHIKKLLDNK